MPFISRKTSSNLLICIPLILCLLVASGCVGIHTGRHAEPVGDNASKLGLQISGGDVSELSSKYFKALEFTFENTREDWVYIESVTVDFGTSAVAKRVLIPAGAELGWWAQAAIQKRDIENYNRAQVLGAFSAFGASMALTSRHIATQKLGLAITAAGLMSLDIAETNAHLRALQGAGVYPERHLLRGPISVPPGLFTKHWLVVQMKDPKLLAKMPFVRLHLATRDKQTVTFKVPLRVKRRFRHSKRGR
jgi:hypothetical protein